MKLQNLLNKPLHKILPLMLLASLLLGACQPQNSPAGDETPVPTDEQLAPTSTIRPTATVSNGPTPTPSFLVPLDQLSGLRINFWHPWSGDTSKQIDLLVDQFNQTNEWGIHVIVSKIGSSMALAAQVDGAQNEINTPQVVVAPSEQLLTWLEQDQRLLPLDEFVNDPYWGFSEQQRAEFGLVFWLQDQSKDRQAGIPAQRSAQVLVYNQTWAQELGFESPPETVQEFREQSCAAAQSLLADNDIQNDGMGGWIVNTDGRTIYSWLKVFDTPNVLRGEPVSFVFNQPQAEQTFSFLRGMLDEGCAWVARNPISPEYFTRRQALFYTASLVDLPMQVSAHSKADSQDEWTVLPFPGEPRPTLVVSGVSYGIFRSTQAEELAAWLFVRWMSSAENQARLLRAGGGLPVSVSAASLADDTIRQTPQWAKTIAWIPFAQPTPQSPGWRVARYILEDAAWQAMQSYVLPDQIPAILEELDATIAEVLERE
jgi:multiple sugar transport system substrate-binding protein